MKPQIPINVDENTGVWDTDGLPMLYVPRHFFVNNHQAIASEIGPEAYAKILYPAGYKSAYFWCDKESKTHDLSGMDVFKHYLNRLSQRGWGLFSFANDDIYNLEIQLENSAFVLHAEHFNNEVSDEQKLCYMFSGWFAGAADWVAKNQDINAKFSCYEKNCAIHSANKVCTFIVEQKL